MIRGEEQRRGEESEGEERRGEGGEERRGEESRERRGEEETNINFISHWFECRTPELSHARPALYRFGHRAQSLRQGGT